MKPSITLAVLSIQSVLLVGAFSFSSTATLPRQARPTIAAVSRNPSRRTVCLATNDANNVNNDVNNLSRSNTTDREAAERAGSLAAATKSLGKVPYGEASRKYRRTVFAHTDWVEHRSSSSRILVNLQSMFFSGVVRQLRPQVGVVTTVAGLVMLWNVGIVGNAITHPEWSTLFYNYLHFDLPTLHVIALPTVPFTLSSPALGLLLVFRTNASYARWMEARSTWARIISHGKNLVRMASVFCPNDEEAVLEFSKVVWLYIRTVMNQLSSPEEDEQVYIQEVQQIYNTNDNSNSNSNNNDNIGQRILNSPDRATAAWKQLSIQLHSLPASDPKALIETDKSIIILGECTAICEKIYSSPVPLVYTRHTARFLSLWALLLPCALYTQFYSIGQEWAVLPASSILAFFLFGVDELAMQLEEPFSILPMQAFCDGVLEAGEVLAGVGDGDGDGGEDDTIGI